MNEDYLVALAEYRKLVWRFFETVNEGVYDIKKDLIDVNRLSPEESQVIYGLFHDGISDLFLNECQRLFRGINALLSSEIKKWGLEEFEIQKNGKTYTFSLDYKGWASVVVREQDGTLNTY